jgi:hypothetical protein
MEDNDQAAAHRERAARDHLLGLGADALDRRPWQPAPIPPTATDLINFFLWWDRPAINDATRREAALAALRLLPEARAELDRLEAGLLFAARGVDLTWAQMAQAIGLNSPQACQQRLDRLLTRQDRPAERSGS